MTFKIEKEFHFSASHQLRFLPAEHQCARLHGHNYILKVALFAEDLDDVGFVLDYGELKFVQKYVDKLDHRHLNDLFSFNPTSENICKYYAGVVSEYLGVNKRITAITVSLSETPKTWAHYTLIRDDHARI